MGALNLGQLAAAAAPGVASGIKGGMDSYQDYKAGQQQDANTAAQTGTANIGAADASHPVWSVLNNIFGGSSPQAAPGAAAGGDVASGIPAPAMSPVQLSGMAAGQGIGGSQAPGVVGPNAVAGMQNGGVVKQNFGKATVRPAFNKGPALPTGPNSGIVPASTEGQILTMDAGGVVPDSFQPVNNAPQPAVSGGPAGFVSGFSAGEGIGRNLRNQWDINKARSAAADYTRMATSADVNNPDDGTGAQPQPGGIHGALNHAKDAVEGFFGYLWNGTLNDAHKPNSDSAIPAGAAPPAGAPASAGDAASPPAAGGPGIPAPSAPGASPNAAAASPPAGGPAPGSPAAPSPGGPAGAPGAGAAPAGAPGAAQPSGQPSGSASPVQTALTADATKAALANPNVAAGVPAPDSANQDKPHSLTPAYWQKMNDLKSKAAAAAAQAGEDPAKVYESLTAMQTAHFQGQVLKQVATASRAYDAGNMDAVKQALKNVNYYLPDGQNIGFKAATADDVAKAPPGTLKVGDLMHSNPYKGMFQPGQPPQPDYVKVDQPYLTSLGQGALDPEKMIQAQNGRYLASAEAQSKYDTAQGALARGKGIEAGGVASLTKANVMANNADVERRLIISHGDLNEAEAGRANREPIDRSSNGQTKVPLASIRARQNDVANYVDNASLGERQVEPTKNPDGSTNFSPAAGKTVPNPARVPSVLSGLTPDQRQNVKQLGGSFAAANPNMTKEEAAEMAARITHIQSAKQPPTHMEADGKRHLDYIPDDPKQPGVAHVWVGNGYRSFYTAPAVDDTAAAAPSPVSAGAGGGGGGGSAGVGDENPATADSAND